MIIDRTSEEHEGVVTEEVEEEPGHKDDEEDDHGDGKPEEAAEEDKEDDEGVIDAEVGEVAAGAGHGLAVAVGAVGWASSCHGRRVAMRARPCFLTQEKSSTVRARGGGLRGSWNGPPRHEVEDISCAVRENFYLHRLNCSLQPPPPPPQH